MPSMITYFNDETLLRWRNNTLTVEEQQAFDSTCEANTRRFQELVDSGILSVDPIYADTFSTVLNSTIAIQIGSKTSWNQSTDFETIAVSNDWEMWLNHFYNDYNIPQTVFE